MQDRQESLYCDIPVGSLETLTRHHISYILDTFIGGLTAEADFAEIVDLYLREPIHLRDSILGRIHSLETTLDGVPRLRVNNGPFTTQPQWWLGRVTGEVEAMRFLRDELRLNDDDHFPNRELLRSTSNLRAAEAAGMLRRQELVARLRSGGPTRSFPPRYVSAEQEVNLRRPIRQQGPTRSSPLRGVGAEQEVNLRRPIRRQGPTRNSPLPEPRAEQSPEPDIVWSFAVVGQSLCSDAVTGVPATGSSSGLNTVRGVPIAGGSTFRSHPVKTGPRSAADSSQPPPQRSSPQRQRQQQQQQQQSQQLELPPRPRRPRPSEQR